MAALEVSNSGPLVPPEQVETLFEPFRRLDGNRATHPHGAGLGLSIVRSIVPPTAGSPPRPPATTAACHPDPARGHVGGRDAADAARRDLLPDHQAAWPAR